MVAMTSKKVGVTADPDVTSTKLGLQRLEQAGKDLYEPGTAAARGCNRFVDALDVNADVEDGHDAALAAAEAAAWEDLEDAAALEH